MSKLPDYRDERYQYPTRIRLIPVDERNRIFDVNRVPGSGVSGTPLNAKFFDAFKDYIRDEITNCKREVEQFVKDNKPSSQPSSSSSTTALKYEKVNSWQVNSSTGAPIYTGKSGVIYLVPNKTGDADKYSEFIYVDGSWEKLGSSASSSASSTNASGEVISNAWVKPLVTAMVKETSIEAAQLKKLVDVEFLNEFLVHAYNDCRMAISRKYARKEHTHNASDIKGLSTGGTGGSGVSLSDMVDKLYPVGTIYVTKDASFNPARTFGGRWDQITDRFLYATSGATGRYGGEETHKLTIDEMPSHDHSSSSKIFSTWGSYSSDVIDTNQRNGSKFSVGKTGGDKAHNNMPPYVTVHAWERKA